MAVLIVIWIIDMESEMEAQYVVNEVKEVELGIL